MKIFEASDGFKLLGLIGAVSNAQKTISINGDYETSDGSELSIEYSGTIQDAQPVKDFLDPQLRAADDKNMEILFQITFNE